MSASRAFPGKLAECHEMLAQFTTELAALKQSVAEYQ
jgi:septal ring factor EnvC (AmiA/AmiB activator)